MFQDRNLPHRCEFTQRIGSAERIDKLGLCEQSLGAYGEFGALAKGGQVGGVEFEMHAADLKGVE